jgi:mercuric reductase
MAEQVDDINAAVATLKDYDMVIFDCNGKPTGAYPFTVEERDHRVTVNGRTVHCMCALDALAVSPMFDMPTHIESQCHITGAAVSIDQLDQQVLNQEQNRSLHFGINWNAAGNSCCATSLCTEMIFLKERETALSWQAEDAENREIFDLGKAIQFATGFFKPLVSG